MNDPILCSFYSTAIAKYLFTHGYFNLLFNYYYYELVVAKRIGRRTSDSKFVAISSVRGRKPNKVGVAKLAGVSLITFMYKKRSAVTVNDIFHNEFLVNVSEINDLNSFCRKQHTRRTNRRSVRHAHK